MKRVILSAVAAFLLLSMTSKAFELAIVPPHKTAAQLGDKLVLTCQATGCESPTFSWRTQLDSPLGGVTSTRGKSSVLTMDSVGFENECEYVCNANCGPVKKQRTVKVDIYSFSSDPVIEVSEPLILGKQARVSCMVRNVYPSNRLEMYLKKEEGLMATTEFDADAAIQSIETKTFIPTEKDTGKVITCIAKLPIDEMEFEPKERQATHTLRVNFGPRNTRITAFPGNVLLEANELTLSCATESYPPASVVWKKQLADTTVQHIAESHNITIPNVQFYDSGIYICEVTNEITNETENRTMPVTVQGAPRLPEFSIFPSATVQEGQSVTLQCSAKSNPAARITIRRKSVGKDVVLDNRNGIVQIPSVVPDDAGDYECEVDNEFGTKRRAGKLHVTYGPRNTTIVVIPSNTVNEGESVTLICSTDGSPPPKISWKKQLASGGPQILCEDTSFTIKNVRADDMGHYECEGVNLAGKDKKAVELIVQVFSSSTSTVTEQPRNVTEVAGIVITNAIHTTLPQETGNEKETTVAPKKTTVALQGTAKDATIRNVMDIFDVVRNGTEEIEVNIVAQVEEAEYITPVIVVIFSLATVAGPTVATLLYISRKAKINRSYSLVNSLKHNV